MLSFKPSAISIALLGSGLCSFSLFAQDNTAQGMPAIDESKIEVIEVRGIRRSLEASQSIKMHSSSVVEAISAEDIGKLPDVSIAESLARLPGVTAQRLNGRSQNISVRGMSGDFSTAQFNGREVVSTGDNRSVEFDQFPSELLNGVVVYKTPDASLIGQGLAGTVDMQTIKPLSHGEQAFSIGGRYEASQENANNPLGEDSGERYNATYIDQFADDTIGIAIGYAHTKSPNQIERFEAWGYGENENGETELGGAKMSSNSNLLERDSVMALFEFTPNDTFTSTLDVFYSEFSETQNNAFMELGLGIWSDAELEPGYTVENGIVTEATYTGVKPIIRNDVNTRDSDMVAIGWNSQYILNDDWEMTFDIAHSRVDRIDMSLETYAGTDGKTDTMSYYMTDSGPMFSHEIDYSDTSQVGLTDSASWGQVGFQKINKIDDTINQVRFELNRMLDSETFSNFIVGSHFIEREKIKATDEYKVSGFTDGSSYQTINNPSGTIDLNQYGLGEMVVYDPLAMLNSGVYVVEPFEHPDVTEKSWLVSEDITTIYAKLDIDADWGDTPVKGNMGFQAVYTDQYSEALSADASNTTVAKSGGTSYWEFLPSLNLSFNIAEDQFIRLGLARTLARPRMDELTASGQYSFDKKYENGQDLDSSPWSASGGNPELKPWIANAVDISYEMYFSETAGYFSLATFYKDLESYIYDQQVVEDFTDHPAPVDCVGPDGSMRVCDPSFNQGYSTTPQNGEGGEIYGAEISLSITGEMLSDHLTGWGATMNASHTESDIQPDPNDPSTPLPGLSEDVVNVTLYYAHQGFETRVSSRYRSEFLGEVSGFGGSRDLRMIQAETIVDAQMSYSFSEGSQFNGLTLLFQANNITNEAFKVYEDNDPDKLLDYQEYGRTFMLGANYSF
jgi:iron complex outermembrane receptor protein